VALGQLDLQGEGLSLRLAGGVLVVVVEAALTDADDDVAVVTSVPTRTGIIACSCSAGRDGIGQHGIGQHGIERVDTFGCIMRVETHGGPQGDAFSGSWAPRPLQ
jgi:hypothetical protein